MRYGDYMMNHRIINTAVEGILIKLYMAWRMIAAQCDAAFAQSVCSRRIIANVIR